MSSRTKSHKQVPAKVTAYVDESIKDLVEILNSFDKVETIESCEGDDNHEAFILLGHGDPNNNDSQETIDFATTIVRRIRLARSNKLILINLAIQWYDCDTRPIILIKFLNRYITDVTNIFLDVKNGFQNGKTDR